MPEVPSIRNIALVGHGGSGKTSLLEAMLYTAGMIPRLGRVDEGTSLSDFDSEEQKRRISVNLALAYGDWRGHRLYLVDTPGYADFIGEVISALPAVESLLFVLSAPNGVEVQTEAIWELAQEWGLPRLIFVNKMETERADFTRCLQELRQVFGIRPVVLHAPWGAESAFVGTLDILRRKARRATHDGKDGFVEEEVPPELQDLVEEYRLQLVEGVAETDEVLLEKYLDEGDLDAASVLQGLRQGVARGEIVPVLAGSAAQGVGIRALLDALVEVMPSPGDRPPRRAQQGDSWVDLTPTPQEPTAVYVFKTLSDPYVGRISYVRVFSGTFRADSQLLNTSVGQRERIPQVFVQQGKEASPSNPLSAGEIGSTNKLVYTLTGHTLADEGRPVVVPPPSYPEPLFRLAVHPKSRDDEERISQGLHRLAEEDPCFHFYRDEDTGELIVAGTGDLHLQVILSRLRERYHVEVETRLPRIAYRETIRQKAERQGRYKRQTGGRGQYGDVWLRLEPLPRGQGFEFVDAIVGGVVPRQYIPAVEKGVREAMQKGILAGYPVVDVRVTLYDGSHHPVDSSDLAFHIAGSLAFRAAAEAAGLVLLEPIMNVEVIVPEEYVGDILGDLSGRRGRIQGTEVRGKRQVVLAQVPLAEMLNYATDLRSRTQGRGRYSMTFSHYEEVPPHLAERIIAEAKARQEQER